jgi:hypothetical protein
VTTTIRYLASTLVFTVALCGCRGCVDEPGSTPNSVSEPRSSSQGSGRNIEMHGWRKRRLEGAVVTRDGDASPVPRDAASIDP